MNEKDLVYHLRKRAEICKSISTHKSVQNNAPDRIDELLEEAADRIELLEELYELACIELAGDDH